MKFLQTTRAGRPTTVEVLDELSRRLPDSTYRRNSRSKTTACS